MSGIGTPSQNPTVTVASLALSSPTDGTYIGDIKFGEALPDTAAGDLAAINSALGGTLTVDGTVTANLSATDNAVLDNIALYTAGSETALELLDNAVDGNYLNVNLNIAGTDVSANAGVLTAQTQRVTIATDDEVNNLLGTIDADTSTMNTNLATVAGDTTAIQTAIEKIDGAVVGPGEPTIDSYTHLAINLNAGANQVLVSSAASKQIWVYGFGVTLSVAGTVSFQDEDDTAITGIMDFAANSGMAIPPSGNFAMPIWKLATNKDLEIDIISASVDGFLCYAIVSV